MSEFESAEAITGLSREVELENILADILDLYDGDEIIPASLMEDEVDIIEDVMDRAREILAYSAEGLD